MTTEQKETLARTSGEPDSNLRGGLPRTIEWTGDRDGYLTLLDQTKLPHEVVKLRCETAEDVWEAIKRLSVRGAPAIGVAAAFGLCLGVREARGGSLEAFVARSAEVAKYLNRSRPTAVNLAWALARMREVLARETFSDAADAWDRLLAEAKQIAREDEETCRKIGEHGAQLVPANGAVLTHCNAGALATVAYGTALSLLYVAKEQGRQFRVFADETRPLLQGARLTAFELAAAGIDTTVLCDGAAASLLASGEIGLVVVGADRIAANGDTANKIGTYGLALAAQAHDVPFYVAAPLSTFDLSLPNGAAIPIEQRDGAEVRGGFGQEMVAPGAGCYNPAFDVTPAALIRGIVTERGLVRPVTAEKICEIFRG